MIQFVSGEYPPDIGGVGDYTVNLRRALAVLGWRSSIVSRREIRHWDVRAPLWFLRNAPRTGIVHIQFEPAAFDLLGDICLLPLLLRRWRPRVHVVTTFHDTRVPYLFPRAGSLRRRAVRLLAQTSHAVIAADQRDLVQLGGPSVKHFHVPIGSNVACEPPEGYSRSAFRQVSLGLGPDDLAVVYFGLLNASKGLDLLLHTFALLRDRCPRTRLILVGGVFGASDKTDRFTATQVEARIHQLRLEGSVVRTGWLASADVSAYLLAADVALLPYRDGASGRRGSLLACAGHCLPIVTTQPAAEEVAGFVRAVDQDPRALADALLEVARTSGPLREASKALADEVSWPRIATRHIAIYDQLLHSPR